MLKYTERYLENRKKIALKRQEIENEIEKRQERIARATKQIEKLNKKMYGKGMWASWIDDILQPLMRDLEKFAGDGWQGEIYGPFGIEAQTSIYLRTDMAMSICDQPTYGLTVYPPDNNGIMMYQTGEVTNKYPKGSIADMNGMNYVKAVLPDTAEEIWKLMTYSDKEV